MPADEPNQSANTADRPSTVPWPPIVLVAVILAAIALNYLAPVSWPGLDDTPARLIGRGIGIVGIILLIWAILTLRQNDTTVLPDVGATNLVTSGPYWRWRNPIYLADVEAAAARLPWAHRHRLACRRCGGCARATRPWRT